MVTAFEPDVERDGEEFDYLVDELLENPNNYELEIKRGLPYGGATREKHPNTSTELSSNKNVPQSKLVVKNSLRDSEDNLSNRSLLANALMETAQNDAELQKLEQYKSKIEDINALEKLLAEVNAKIKEISFSKGKRDQAELKKLKEEKIKTGNRLNIYDNQLLRIEASKPLKDILTRERQNFKKAQAESQKAFKNAQSEWNKALKTAQDEGKRTLKNAQAEWREAFKKAQAEGRELAQKEREKAGFPIWYS